MDLIRFVISNPVKVTVGVLLLVPLQRVDAHGVGADLAPQGLLQSEGLVVSYSGLELQTQHGEGGGGVQGLDHGRGAARARARSQEDRRREGRDQGSRLHVMRSFRSVVQRR